MSHSIETRTRYSEDDLREFEELIRHKLESSKSELAFIRETLSRRNDEGTDSTSGGQNSLEDGADSLEKENLNSMAARLQKFIAQLELAMIRIKNGTYGVCVDTGKLIPKERLRLVPHTQHSIEAKLKKSN